MIIFKKYFKELILFFTILLDIFGFFGLVTPEFEILDKIIAWVVFAYFFYELSVSKLFFGEKDKFIDIFILFAYFNLESKNFLVFFNEIINDLTSKHIASIVSWVLTNGLSIELFTFYIGVLVILLVSLYTAYLSYYTRESFFARLLKDKTFENDGSYIGAKEKPPSKFKKTILSFFLYNAFFLIIFNLFVEWLGFIEDDMITVFSIIILLILIKRHKENFKTPKIIEKITTIADDFYGNIVASVNRKRYITLLFTGILSLQILTDFLIFIYPLILGKNEVSYFGGLSGHTTLINVILNDISLNLGFSLKAGVFFAYVLDVIFLIFLMSMPIYIWYITYTEEKEKIPDYLIVLFFISLVSFALKPILKFQSLSEFSGGIYSVFGIDIIIQNLMSSTNLHIFHLIILSLLTGLLVYALLQIFKKFILFIFTLINYCFILTYVYFFIKGTLVYYYNEIKILWQINHWLLSAYFVIFVLILIIFYIIAVMSFALEINSEFDFFQKKTDNEQDTELKTKEIYTPVNYESFMKEHPMLKHLKLYMSVMILTFIVFLLSVFLEVEEVTGNIKLSTNFIVEDILLLILSGLAIFMILAKIRKMRDKHFKKNHFIKRNINKKIIPLSLTILLIGLSTLFMAIRDKSRAFTIADITIDKDWIHIILFNIILLFYLYFTFVINKKDKKDKKTEES